MVCIIFGKSYLQAKSRMHHANEIRASKLLRDGNKVLPSWANKKLELDIFVETLKVGTVKKGAPEHFWAEIEDEQALIETLLHFAGAMEQEGASKTEQQIAAIDKVATNWRALITPRV